MTALTVDQIRVEDRHRKDLGDLSGLVASIRSVGLLHPIVVTSDGRLVAGQRRLAACTTLGWDEVPVTVAGSLDEARALLEAERDENTCRLDMAPSEKVALGRALEELERPNREANRTANLPGHTKPENFRVGDTRDLVGEAVGMSGRTYQRAKAVITAAEEGDPVAEEAAAEMDATGKVTPAYEKVTGKPTSGREIAAAKAITRDGTRKRSAIDLFSNVTEKLAGYVPALREIDVGSAIANPDAPLAAWDKQLTEVIQTLHRIRGDIRKEMNT